MLIIGYHGATDDMSDDYDPHEGRAVMAEGSFGESVVFPPNDFPPGKMLLFEAVRGFAAERAGRSVAACKAPEIESFALPIREALIGGLIRVTCIACAGPYLDVVPTAFRDRQTWRATFEEGVILPIRPRVGIEPGSLIIDKSEFERFVTGFRAEKLWERRVGAYIPPIIKLAIRIVHRLGIKNGNYSYADLKKALSVEAEKEGLRIGDRSLGYLARFATDPEHFQNGWNSTIPPVYEFMLEMVEYYSIHEGRRFIRDDFGEEILEHAAKRPDLGILPTHATHIRTFCGNPKHSSGGSFPRKPGAPEPRLSRTRKGKDQDTRS